MKSYCLYLFIWHLSSLDDHSEPFTVQLICIHPHSYGASMSSTFFCLWGFSILPKDTSALQMEKPAHIWADLLVSGFPLNPLSHSDIRWYRSSPHVATHSDSPPHTHTYLPPALTKRTSCESWARLLCGANLSPALSSLCTTWSGHVLRRCTLHTVTHPDSLVCKGHSDVS